MKSLKLLSQGKANMDLLKVKGHTSFLTFYKNDYSEFDRYQLSKIHNEGLKLSHFHFSQYKMMVLMCVMSYLSQTAHAFAKLTRYDPFEQNPDILEYFGPGTSRTDSEKLMSGWIDPKTLEPIEMLDLRVGKITKVWKHENSTKLYCEEVDLGEEQPRQIASGLQEFVPIERMQNSMVVVAANLKPRRVAGFMSHGMIL
jgi:tRNA-binding EMAP/Myf-like protein